MEVSDAVMAEMVQMFFLFWVSMPHFSLPE
jgi:hypothetical protein